MDRVLTDAISMPGVIDDLSKLFTQAELSAIRKRTPYELSLISKIMKAILQISANLFGSHPAVTRAPDAAELPDTFIFRNALCCFLLALRWISVGGAMGVRPEKLRNDMVDMNFAAYGSYFDGLLTADEKVADLHIRARTLLTILCSPEVGAAG